MRARDDINATFVVSCVVLSCVKSVAVLGGGVVLLAKVPWHVSVLCLLVSSGVSIVGIFHLLTQHVLDLAAHGQNNENQPVDDQDRPEDGKVENLAP